MTADPVVRAEVRGRLGLLTLDRPSAMNALDRTMVLQLTERLDAWRRDDAVQVVAVTGAGDRGLCAGGDIVSMYRDAGSGDLTGSIRFLRDEYRLNAAIARYPKPYVAIQDGIVLGGGIGISAHGSHRVVTERSRLGLPETGIGFVPDVGASWLLARAPGGSGTRLALSAATVGAADAIHVGLADVLVPSARIPELLQDLETDDVDAAVGRSAEPAGPSAIAADAAWVDPAFDADSVSRILVALRAHGGPGTDLAATIAAKSPTATAVALASIRQARRLPSLEAALDVEFRVSLRCLGHPDFAEGVRAQVIDKNRRPRWRPAGHDGVDDTAVAAFFAPLGADELGLARRGSDTERRTA